jgi:pyridoxine kinase
VAYGHVGNSAAVFPLQRIGVEVWPVNTVQFSNHTGYGAWRGPVLAAETVSEIVQGIQDRGVFDLCDGVLSGYLGDASLGEVVLTTVEKVKEANPRVVYCCDPVMGDIGRGFFVRPGIPEFMREKALPAATIVTPNHFELEYLSRRKITDLADVREAIEVVQSSGPSVVLVTSLCRTDGRTDQIEMLAADRISQFLIATPLLPLIVNGAGDMTAALFFAHWLRLGTIATALELTANAIFSVLEVTHQMGSREIQLVAAQSAIAEPRIRFKAEAI